jgi:hypothetical protein
MLLSHDNRFALGMALLIFKSELMDWMSSKKG